VTSSWLFILQFSQDARSNKYQQPSIIIPGSQGLGSTTPPTPQQKSKNPRTTDYNSINKTNVLAFLVFFFSLQQHWDGSCYFICLFVSHKIIPHGWRTSSNCQADLMLLSVEGPTVAFLFLRLSREVSKPRSTNRRKVRDESMNTFRRSSLSNMGNWPMAVSHVPYIAE
jgi:hypothetical protein